MKNPFSYLFRARDKPQNAVSTAPSFYFGMSGSGKSVSPSSAIQVSAVYACVRVIAETIASLPFHEAPEMEAQIDHIEVPADNHLKFYLRGGRVEERIWKDRSRRESWTPEMKEKARQNAMKRKR